MKRIALLLITHLCCFLSMSYAQEPINGIINDYASVLSIDNCGIIELETTTAFFPADRVLLIQMKGLSIDQSNTNNFGSILDYNTAGHYEFANIANVENNYIYLDRELINSYSTDYPCQLVRVPVYSSALVTATLTAKEWDGQTGGILAFEVDSTLTLEGDIDLSNKGFRGAALQNINSDCYFLFNTPDYYYGANNWRAAFKGESAAISSPGKEAGRGPLANGGGGGNDHNAGGGGGGNAGKGGDGGKQLPPGVFFCDGDYPGIGGLELSNTTERIFLGGAGGAPHIDDTNAGSIGGNGGGIIMIKTNQILGNNYTILSNGESPALSLGDGGGGAGAAGSILLQANTVIDLNIEAKGGNGGNVNNGGGRCYGPGGAGGGGFLISNLNGLNPDLGGGEAGINLNPSSDCTNPQSDAEAGTNGTYIVQDSLWLENTNTLPLITASADSLLLCSDTIYQLSLSPELPAANYQWQLNTGQGFEDLTENFNFTNTQSPILSISNDGNIPEGSLLQCQISLGCETAYSPLVPILISNAPTAILSQTITNDSLLLINQSTNYETVFWYLNGELLNENSDSISMDIQDPGLYNIDLVVFNNCGSDSSTVSILSGDSPQADFSENLNTFCAPFTVSFQDESQFADSISWSFEGGQPAFSSDPNPSVTYSEAGTFDLRLIAHNLLGNDTLFLASYIQAYEAPTAAFELSSEGLIVNTINLSGGPDDFLYRWKMGDGSTEYVDWQVIHEYASEGSYLIEFSAENEGCYASSNKSINLSTNSASRIEDNNYLMIQPNPFVNGFNLHSDISEKGWIRLIDLDGNTLYEELLEAGKHHKRINLNRIESRLLILQITINNQVINKRIIQKKTAP